MKAEFKKAYKKLEALGVPLFERTDHPDGFFISAEHEGSSQWLNYLEPRKDWGFEKVNPKIREVLEPLGLFAEWENPGCLGVYE